MKLSGQQFCRPHAHIKGKGKGQRGNFVFYTLMYLHSKNPI
jgi:hypothetical protein